MMYERPVVIATYSVERLRAEAAAVCCVSLVILDESDQKLKTDIQPVAEPLKRLGAV
jgi:hypothetical protein